MRYSVYPKYKPSSCNWLDMVPAEWQVKRLRFCIKSNPTKSEIHGLDGNTSVSFVPMEAVGELGGLRLDQTKPLDEVAVGYTYFRDGDVVVAKITPCFENGKSAIATDLENSIGFGTTELHVLRPGQDIDRRFLFYITLSHAFRLIGASYMYGAGGQKRVPEDFIKDFIIPTPSVSLQRSIVVFLDRETVRIDALIEKKQRQIELLQEKRSALISHTVTKGLNPNTKMKDSGIEWPGKIPEHWDILQLRRVVSRFVDYRGRTPAKTDEGVPLITAGAIKNGLIDHSLAPEYMAEEDYAEWMSRGLPEVGDLVITTEAPLAEVAQVVDEHVAFAQRIILFKVKRRRMTPDFLRYYYLSNTGRAELLSRASGSTATGIRSDRLRMSLVIVPPLEEQEHIVKHLDSRITRLSTPIGHILQSIEVMREYRTALISAAVTGKIDVRETEVTKTPKRKVKATPEFRRAVLAAEIAAQCHKEPTFGRVKFQKILHLCEYHAKLPEFKSDYRRHAAGPLDRKMIYSVEKQLADQKWFAVTERPSGGASYTPLEKTGGHTRYFNRYWGEYRDSIQEVIDLLLKLNTERCEIISTLYAAWNDLIISGKPFDDSDVLREVLTNWHESKERFEEDRLRKALQWMREKGLVPVGVGKPTLPASQLPEESN